MRKSFDLGGLVFVERVFSGSSIKMLTEGHKYLGCLIGRDNFEQRYLLKKLDG